VVFEYDQKLSLIVPVAHEDNELVAVLQIPFEKVLAPFSSLNAQLFTLALLFSGVAGIVALFLARSVTRPVTLLAAIAKQIAGGIYKTPLKVKSNDELGDLAAAFLSMQSAIFEREKQVVFQSQHDPLTNLPNRSRVFPELLMAIDNASSKEIGFSLLIIDIRNFTEINDELSHEIGDMVLAKAGRLLADNFTDEGKVLRFGSDEFLCLVPWTSSGDSSEKIHALFRTPLVLGKIQITIEVNIGISHYPYDANSAENLLRRASLALNRGRANGKNTCFYEHGWDELHMRRLHLFREFENSLRNNHFSLHFQPKINFNQAEVLGAEALVRWNRPIKGW
ncbi:MAG: diguanylate cyclase, partial [Moraxellaceae bacterium]